jgi:outer membrane protein assembly factor BamB
LWSYTSAGGVESSPVVSGGYIYFGSLDHNVYCLNAQTGAKVWTYTTGSSASTTGAGEYTPAVSGGYIYFGSLDHNLYCLDAQTGTKMWSYTTGGSVYTPAISGSYVYVGSSDHNLYCLNAQTGAKVWSYAAKGWACLPAVSGGFVYVGSADSNIYCLNAQTGTKVWSYSTGGYVLSSPAVSGSYVYFGSYDHNVYCLNAQTGAKVWNYTTGGNIFASPAVAGGYVYVSSLDNDVYCLNAQTGTKMWSYTTSSSVYSSPAVTSSFVYVGSADSNIYCLNAQTGAKVWSYSTGGYVLSSPAVSGSIVYIGSDDHNVYAFGTPGTTQPTNQTKPTVFIGGVANGTTVASNKVTMNLQTPTTNTTYYEVRVDAGDWVNIGLPRSYTFGGLSLGKHVLEERAVTVSGKVTGSSNVTVTVSVWVPPATNAVASGITIVGVFAVVSLLAIAVSNPATIAGNWLVEKLTDLLPEYAKEWLESFVSSKRSQDIESKAGSIFILTKLEVVAYVVTLFVLTIAFSYSGAGSMEQFLVLIPTVLVTSVAVGLLSNLLMELVARLLGVWAEHRLWYFGLATFTLSTVIFKVPFSSPSRVLQHTPHHTKRTLGIAATASIMITLGFAAVFYAIQVFGFTIIGSIGLAMCLLSALFSTIPIPLMNGKDIWDWNKLLWVVIFLITVLLYAYWLIYV